MSDSEFIEEIRRMDTLKLFSLVLAHSEYLVDSYYSDFGRAIRERATELGVDA